MQQGTCPAGYNQGMNTYKVLVGVVAGALVITGLGAHQPYVHFNVEADSTASPVVISTTASPSPMILLSSYLPKE